MKTILLLSFLFFGPHFATESAKPAAELRTGLTLKAPNGCADFLITADRKAIVTFIDSAGKLVERGDRTVIIKVDGKNEVLEPQKYGFITKDPLPAKEPALVVVQIRFAVDAKPINFRVRLNTSICHECNRPEYCCNCGH